MKIKNPELTLEETQKISLDILKRVISICEELHINYWITYGTLLGAIRHGGLIPWDDDLDIGMTLEDYNTLIQYMNTHKEELYPLVLHNKYTVANCFYNISRICDERFVFEFTQYKYCSGAFIDIYPYEGLGKIDQLEEWKKWFKKNNLYKKYINMSCSRKILYGNNLLTQILNLPKCIYSKLRGNTYFLGKMDDYKAADFMTSEIVGVPRWGAAIYRNYYREFTQIKFEDIFVNVPKEYDLILREAYGDYMQYPPAEQRKPYHGYVAYRAD